MKALRFLVLLLGLAALAFAVVWPLREVKTADGHSCGTAWHGARAELLGKDKQGGVDVISLSCKNPRKKVLKQAGGAAAGGAVLLVIVAAWPSQGYRRPEVIASQI